MFNTKRLKELEAERDAIQETLTFVEGEVGEVYNHISNGKLSKCNYTSDVLIAAADEWAWKQTEAYLQCDFPLRRILDAVLNGNDKDKEDARERVRWLQIVDSEVINDIGKLLEQALFPEVK